MNKQKRCKQIATGIVLLLALVIGLNQMKFQSVDSYEKEKKQIEEELGLSESSEKDVEAESTVASTDSENDDLSVSQKKADGEIHQKNQKKNSEKKYKTEKTKKNQTKKNENQTEKETGKRKQGNASGKSHKNSSQRNSSQNNQKEDGSSKKPSKDNSIGEDTAATSQPVTPEESSSQPEATAAPASSTENAEKEDSKATPAPTKEPEKDEKEKITCKVQIVCNTLVENKQDVDSSIWKYIPSNGILLAETTITVDKGTTAYDALSQICKAKSIALDSEYTPLYKSYYVKGIGHLYEKQAGDRSGWVYKINGKSPNKGASSYVLSEGDTMTWTYTCDGKTS